MMFGLESMRKPAHGALVEFRPSMTIYWQKVIRMLSRLSGRSVVARIYALVPGAWMVTGLTALPIIPCAVNPRYRPSAACTMSPGCTSVSARRISRQGLAAEQGFVSLPDGETE